MKQKKSTVEPLLHREVRELRAQLERTKSPEQQLPVLERLSEHLCRIDIREAERYAQRAVKLALSIRSDYRLMRSYSRLACSLEFQSQYAASRMYLLKALKLQNILPHDPVEKALLHSSLARMHIHMGDVGAAVTMAESAVRFALESGDKQALAGACGRAGSVYRSAGMLGESLHYLERGLELYTELQYEPGMSLVMGTIGDINAAAREWADAVRWYEKSLTLNSRIGDRHHRAMTLKALGNTRLSMGEYDAALECFDRALEISREIHDRYNHAQTLMAIGYLHGFRENHDEAYRYFNRGLEVFGTLENPALRAFALVGIAQVHSHRQDWDAAIGLLMESLDLWTRAKKPQHQALVHKLLGETYERMEEFDNALFYYKRYREFELKTYSREIRRKLSLIDLRERLRETGECRPETAGSMGGGGTEKLPPPKESVSDHFKRMDRFLMRIREQVGKDDPEEGTLLSSVLSYAEDAPGGIEGRRHPLDPHIEQWDRIFLRKLTALCPSLTPAQLRVSALVRNNLSTQEIADLLYLSERTVDTHRTHIRKKLRLEPTADLAAFLAAVETEEADRNG